MRATTLLTSLIGCWLLIWGAVWSWEATWVITLEDAEDASRATTVLISANTGAEIAKTADIAAGLTSKNFHHSLNTSKESGDFEFIITQLLQ